MLSAVEARQTSSALRGRIRTQAEACGYRTFPRTLLGRLAGLTGSPARWRMAYYSCPGLCGNQLSAISGQRIWLTADGLCLGEPAGFEPPTLSIPFGRAP